MAVAWGAIGVVSAGLAGMAGNAMGWTPPAFTFARWAFIVSAILVGGMTVIWSIKTDVSIGARLATSGVIGAGLMIFLPVALMTVTRREHVYDLAHEAQTHPRQPATQSTMRYTVLSDGRIVVNVTPKDLLGLFSNRTSAQAAALTKQYIGKWITAKGQIYDIDTSGETFDYVFFKEPSFPRMADLSLMMLFDSKRWHDRLTLLNPGDTITVRGKIDEITKSTVKLRDCELP